MVPSGIGRAHDPKRGRGILADIIEADVAGHSSGLAVAASPGSPSKRLVCLLRAGEETGSFEFSLTRRRPRSHADIADSGDDRPVRAQHAASEEMVAHAVSTPVNGPGTIR